VHHGELPSGAASREPGFRTNAAHFAVLTDDLPAARDHLRVARRPVSRARLRRMVPEVFLIDAAMVG